MDNENKTTLNGIDDSGKRMSYGEGKATREPSEGKGRYDLITPFGLARLAKWYELGAQKYSDRNWEKGMPFSRCIDSAKRHIDKYIMGMKDEDHLSAAVWNLLCIIHFEELGMTNLNDLPCYLYLWQLKPSLEEKIIENTNDNEVEDSGTKTNKTQLIKHFACSYCGYEEDVPLSTFVFGTYSVGRCPACERETFRGV